TYTDTSEHDLYLGTSLYSDRAKFAATLDGTALTDLDTYLDVSTAVQTRRILSTSVAAGTHTLVLTTKTANASSTGTNSYFDYLQIVVAADPVDATITYNNVSAALDFDTDQTYKLAPARTLDIYKKLGFLGDLDLYSGVFFALKRKRRGGKFTIATCTISGSFTNTDDLFIDVGGTSFGAEKFASDTVDTLKGRFVNGINTLFVGVRAYSTGTGTFAVKILSPINGFTLSVSTSTGATGSFTLSGNISAGNEGVWEVDDSQTSPLNRGYTDWLTDFVSTFDAASIKYAVAFSQELLAPPDLNTSAGAWIQRYSDGTTVLTATEFGHWGTGYVEAYTSSTKSIKQTGHGYLDGYAISIVNGTTVEGKWSITVVDADNYELTTLLTSGDETVSVGDTAYADLQTSQCAFNPDTVTVYMKAVYSQTATILGSTGWLQFGEVLHWFFDNGTSMAYYDANQKAAAETSLSRALHVFTGPNDDPTVNSSADANFLVSRLQDHIHAIASTVTSNFELLWPYDVNWDTVFTNEVYPYNTGGQLNRYVNLPSDYLASGSDIDRIKMEALAWGTSYRNLTNAKAAIKFPFTKGTWGKDTVIYLVPCDNGGCPWQLEAFSTLKEKVKVCFWALDHIILFSWDFTQAYERRKSISEAY
ncbi:MAG: hypothetical protein ACREHG_06445, partial [Candidatus Saccharimonadales bacterium]